jgi:hypothetical protein
MVHPWFVGQMRQMIVYGKNVLNCLREYTVLPFRGQVFFCNAEEKRDFVLATLTVRVLSCRDQ